MFLRTLILLAVGGLLLLLAAACGVPGPTSTIAPAPMTGTTASAAVTNTPSGVSAGITPAAEGNILTVQAPAGANLWEKEPRDPTILNSIVLEAGTRIRVEGRTADGSLLLVTALDGFNAGATGWMSQAEVGPEPSLTLLPVVAITPAPRIPTAIAENFRLATQESIVATLVAGGIDPQSAEATAQAMTNPTGMPSPYPIPLITTTPQPCGGASQPACVGSNNGRVSFVQLANASDLQKAQQAYQAYFDFLSFRMAPPQGDFGNKLMDLMYAVDESPSFCPYGTVVSRVDALITRGQYIRVTSLTPVALHPVRQLVSPAVDPIALSLEFSSVSFKLELLDATTGKVLEERQRTIGPSPTLVYLAEAKKWAVQSDPGGYCSLVEEFLR